MNDTHLQKQTQAEWEQASDEQIVSALFQPVRFVNPRWIRYIERYRPQALRTYLQMHAAQGGYLGAPAKRFLND